MVCLVEHLEELQNAIEFRHHCKPAHKGSVFVHEKNEKGETAWKGYVEIFELIGHKGAELCYAWLNRGTNGIKILTVLGSHLINSAQRAVQAAIFVDAQIAFSDSSPRHKQIQRAKEILRTTEIKSEDLNAAGGATEHLKQKTNKRKKES